LEEAAKLVEETKRMDAKQQKADKLDSKVGLDMWREKTGKEQHLDRDRAREANQATIDRKRRADSQRKAVELNGGVADDLEALAEEEAVLLDQKYAARDVAARKAELESMMADLDSKIEEQKQWQGSMQDALSKILEGYKMQERLSKFEEFSKEGATAEKAQVARQVDEKKKAKAGLDMWREKTGKEPQLEVERQRKVQEKAITKKRNAQRREADALYPSADEEEEEMIAEMEALEARVGLLQQDLEANRRWNLAAQQVLQKEAEEITKDDAMLSIEDSQTKTSDKDMIRVKQQHEERRQKLRGLDLWRVKTGKDVTDPNLKKLKKSITKARHSYRESKKDAEVAAGETAEDAMVELDQQVEYAEVAALVSRIEAIETQLERAEAFRTTVQEALGDETEDAYLNLEEQYLDEAEGAKMKNKRLRSEKKEQKDGIQMHREKTGRPDYASSEEQSKKVSRIRKERRNSDDDEDMGPGAVGAPGGSSFMGISMPLGMGMIGLGVGVLGGLYFLQTKYMPPDMYLRENESQSYYSTIV
jgi:hypothetical protein